MDKREKHLHNLHVITLIIFLGVILGVFSISFVSAQVHTIEIGAYGDNYIQQTISLNTGWNLISLGVVPDNKSIERIIGNIKDKVIVINGFDNGAKTYDPLYPMFSDLLEMDEKHGYWVKMNSNANLSIIGTIVSNKTINLNNNWNLIGYMCDSNKNVDDVFSGIMNKVVIINGFESGPGGGARTYDPKFPQFSDLLEMKPKYGYWVKMNESAVMNYNC